MSRWDQLFSRMRQIESAQREADRQRREADRARKEQDEWAERALDELWAAAEAEVNVRVESFSESTGSRVEPIRHSNAEQLAGLPALRILELRLGSSAVYLYSHHAPGCHVHVHVAHWPVSDPNHRRHHRMISLPVCTLDRVGERGWQLRRVQSSGDKLLSVEDLVYRAFELLVFGLERPSHPSLLPPAPPAPLGSGAGRTIRQFPER